LNLDPAPWQPGDDRRHLGVAGAVDVAVAVDVAGGSGSTRSLPDATLASAASVARIESMRIGDCRLRHPSCGVYTDNGPPTPGAVVEGRRVSVEVTVTTFAPAIDA
jgi:hypothetical protein